MTALTWSFRAAFIVGTILATTFVVRYHRKTGGAWRSRSAGVTLMGMVAALGLAFAAVTGRILARLAEWPWLDYASLIVSNMSVWAIVAFIAHRLLLLERYQHDDSGESQPEKESTK